MLVFPVEEPPKIRALDVVPLLPKPKVAGSTPVVRFSERPC